MSQADPLNIIQKYLDQGKDSAHPLLEEPGVKAIMDELEILKLVLTKNGRAGMHELHTAYYEWNEGMRLRPEIIIALTIQEIQARPEAFGLKLA